MGQFMDSFISTFSGFMQAALVTLQITVVSLVLASVIGLFVALMKISHKKMLSWLANIYIGLIRGTPLIVQIMWLYFGITQIVVLSAFWAGAIALAIHSGAYIAEIFRGPSSLLIRDKWKLQNLLA